MHLQTAIHCLAVFLCSTWLANITLAAKPTGERHIYRVVDDRELSLYVTKPDDWQSSDKRPAIVFFHGGGWVGGAPGQFTEHSKYLASRGMVAIQVEYRLLDKTNNDPPTICIDDARTAMIWVRRRANELGIDPERIASGGGSAGGHLAAFVGMVDHAQDSSAKLIVSSKSNAMLLFNPVFDNGPEGWGKKRVGKRYKEFSPMHNITSDDPPAIVFLGSADQLIPVKTVEKFQEEMQQAGNQCEIHIYEGQPHGFFNHGRNGNRWYYETVIASDRFLKSLGWLTGEPTLAKPESK